MTTERWFVQDITQPIVVQHCEGVVFTADNNGNVIGVNLFDGGIPISPGGTATCNVIRPDGVTVSFDGTVSGNAISATLPVTALAVPGVIGVVLQSISGSVVTTVFKGQFTCELTTTETVVAPSVPTSSLAQLTQDVIDLQNNKVNRAGDTMTGMLQVPLAAIYPTGSYATIYFKSGANAQNLGYIGMNVSNRRILFATYAPGNNSEVYYRLPVPTTNEAGAGYDVLTSKSPVTVAQGGTGMSAPQDGSLTWSASITPNEVTLEKFGAIVILNAAFTVKAQIGTYQTVCTLPTGYRCREATYNAFAWAATTMTKCRIYTGGSEGGIIRNRDALATGAYIMTMVFMTA